MRIWIEKTETRVMCKKSKQVRTRVWAHAFCRQPHGRVIEWNQVRSAGANSQRNERVDANAYIYMRGNFSLGCLRFMRYLGVLDCVYNVPGYRSSYWYYYLNTSIFGHILKSIVSGSAEFGDLVLIICEMVSRSERWNNWLLLHCQLKCRQCAYRNPHSTSPRAIDQFTHRERETEREWQTDRLTDRQIDRHIGFDIDTSIRYMDRHRSIKCC